MSYGSTQITLLNGLHILLLFLRDYLASTLRALLESPWCWASCLLLTLLFCFLLILWPRGWDTEPGCPAIKSGKRETSQNVMSFGELCLLLLLLSEKQNGSDVRCCFGEQHIPSMPFCCPSVTTRTVKGGFGIEKAGFGITTALLLWLT